MATQTHLTLAIAQINFARNYTLGLLQDIPDSEWFLQPPGVGTHVAWQVGHLAMAEYALTMLRIRGKEPEDAELISSAFFRRFQKGTKPQADPSAYPSPPEIRQVFTDVHEHALRALAGYDEHQLAVSLPEPHAVFATKLGSIFFCATHELIHAGQIGLLRRLLGKDPVR